MQKVNMATRWGIASAGKIASEFTWAMKALPAEQHRLVAVAARSLDDAKKFAAEVGVERAYGSYAELAADPDVEVVYVGMIQSYHLPVASMMIKAGKHVLCEKPLCMNLRETKQLLALAKEKKVFLMEGLWSRFFPVYQEMKRQIKAGEIGDVVQVFASFGLDVSHLLRLQKPETGGGATLDFGIYPTQLITLIMEEKPLKVLAGGHLNQHGVDETVSATLVYPKGRTASFNITMKAQLPNEAYIIGTKGTIKINSPLWCPESMETPSGTFTSHLPRTSHTYHFPNSQGLMYEATEVRRCLKEGLLESPGVTHSDTITITEITEAIRKQVGTVYPQD